MAKFKKKPVIVDAVQWDGTNVKEVTVFTGWQAAALKGNINADINDWIIKGVKGEFYPCKPDIFEATYDRLD